MVGTSVGYGARAIARKVINALVEPAQLFDDVHRSLLHFVIDPTQVLTDHADHEQLHSAEQQNHDEGRRPSTYGVAAYEPLVHRPARQDDAHRRHDHTEVGRESQWDLRECDDAIDPE